MTADPPQSTPVVAPALRALTLPAAAALVRSTPEFTADTVPVGLLSAHHLAAGVWGVLRVTGGAVTFVTEADGASRRLRAGESQVIAPETAHHVEPGPDATFVIEFHR